MIFSDKFSADFRADSSYKSPKYYLNFYAVFIYNISNAIINLK